MHPEVPLLSVILYIFSAWELIRPWPVGVLDEHIKETSIITPGHALRDAKGTSFTLCKASHWWLRNVCLTAVPISMSCQISHKEGKVWELMALPWDEWCQSSKSRSHLCVRIWRSAVAALAKFRRCWNLSFLLTQTTFLQLGNWCARNSIWIMHLMKRTR